MSSNQASVPAPKRSSKASAEDVRAAVGLQDLDNVWGEMRSDAWQFLKENYVAKYSSWGKIPGEIKDKAIADFVSVCRHSDYLKKCRKNWLAKWLLSSSANNNWGTGSSETPVSPEGKTLTLPSGPPSPITEGERSALDTAQTGAEPLPERSSAYDPVRDLYPGSY